MNICTEETFLLFAAHHYENPHCFDMEEFYDDLKRFKYIKRLLIKYKESGELRERLILNHLIVLYNVFGKKATDMIFLKLDGYYEEIKPFLILLGYMPEVIEIENRKIYNSDIKLDSVIVNKLRGI